MIKKLVLAVIAALIFAVMTGCTTDYNKNDIEEFVSQELHLADFTVSDTYEEFEGDDGYTDRIWTVTDNHSSIAFHVVDDYHWGMESMTNYLWTDYSESVLYNIAENLNGSEVLKFDCTSDENGIFSAKISCSYKNKNELAACAAELKKLQDELEALGYPDLNIGYQVMFEHPLRNVTNYVIDDGDFFGRICDEIIYDDMLNEYITTLMDYRYDDMYLLSDEEILAALDEYPYIVGKYSGSQTDRKLYEEELIEYYHNIIANKYSYGISFGSLYEILKTEGFDVQGDFWHYTYSFNGDVYEISYDFNDKVFDDFQGNNGYYYLKNGEEIPMDYYFYNHFSVKKIKELTGLTLLYY